MQSNLTMKHSIEGILRELQVLADEQRTLLSLHPTALNGAEDAAYENRDQRIVELRWELEALRHTFS